MIKIIIILVQSQQNFAENSTHKLQKEWFYNETNSIYKWNKTTNVSCYPQDSCINSFNCHECSNVTNVKNSIHLNHSINVTYGQKSSYIYDSVSITTSTFVYNSSNITQSEIIKNSKYVEDSTNLENCRNCIKSKNVWNAINISEVTDSHDVSDLHTSSNCIEVKKSTNCFNCINVYDSHFCTNCKNCYDCSDCQRCTGYKCRNSENCRNSKWRWEWWEPDANDTKAWKCSNPITQPNQFEKFGYVAPVYLNEAQISNDIEFCKAFDGNRSCCDKLTTFQIRQIFTHYKETLELRSTQKIQYLKSIFERYKNISISQVEDPKYKEIHNSIASKLRIVKQMIYDIAIDMNKCGQELLKFSAGMMCLGCMPDWQWQKYVPQYVEYSSDEEFFNFDAEEKIIETTLNFAHVLEKHVQISKPFCEDTYQVCRKVMEQFQNFRNISSKSIGLLNEGFTESQTTPDEQKKLEYKQNITQEISNLINRNIIYYQKEQDGDESFPDPFFVPTQLKKEELTPKQLAIVEFKESLIDVGVDYPYDPVIYYNFHPSINFDEPVYLTDDHCQTLAQTNRNKPNNCFFCVNQDPKLVNNWTIPRDCYDNYDEIWIRMDKATNKQYKEFSVFFFQVRAVFAIYEEGDQSFVRHILFPPFREMEIYVKLKGKTFEEKKQFYTNLENTAKDHFQRYEALKNMQDQFTMWNDEFWMFYIYGEALNQAKDQYKYLEKQHKFTKFKFLCDYSGYCSVCDLFNPSDCKDNQAIESKFESYCNDCHFSKVKVDSICDQGTCITCLYIGGDPDDIDEQTYEQNQPIQKCFFRVDTPFFDPQHDINSEEFYAPFHREIGNQDDFQIFIVDYDLLSLQNIKFNIATISEWFYQMEPFELTKQYSVNNVKKINLTNKLPDMSDAIKYKYIAPCTLQNPVNECKTWICSDLQDNMFPNLKFVYDPQHNVDQAYDFLQANASTNTWQTQILQNYQIKLKNGNYARELSWVQKYGSPSPEENDTYYDISQWGPLMGIPSDFQIYIDGISLETNIQQKTLIEEKRGSKKMFTSLLLFTMIIQILLQRI